MNSGPALLAAVVVNYGTPTETMIAVQSLVASHRAPERIFVVDNGSGRDARARLAVEPHAVVIESDRNLGFPAGANLGIHAARAAGADHVFLLNSDAAVAPDGLARLLRALDADPDAGIAGALVHDRAAPACTRSAGIDYSRRTGRVRERRRAPASDAAIRVDAVSGCAMLVRGRVFDRIGGFAEEYFFSFEDVDFCLRAQAAGFRTLLVPSAAVAHEGSRSIGRRSPERLYFAARNHLLLAGRFGPAGAIARRLRDATIVGLNVAHALITSEAPRLAGLASVVRGVHDHARGRYGAL